RLPARYRAPLVLCYLEGRTRDETAGLLGWSAGSVKGRLERGRELLRQRLLRRGLTLGAALGLLLVPALPSAALARNAVEPAGGATPPPRPPLNWRRPCCRRWSGRAARSWAPCCLPWLLPGSVPAPPCMRRAASPGPRRRPLWWRGRSGRGLAAPSRSGPHE